MSTPRSRVASGITTPVFSPYGSRQTSLRRQVSIGDSPAMSSYGGMIDARLTQVLLTEIIFHVVFRELLNVGVFFGIFINKGTKLKLVQLFEQESSWVLVPLSPIEFLHRVWVIFCSPKVTFSASVACFQKNIRNWVQKGNPGLTAKPKWRSGVGLKTLSERITGTYVSCVTESKGGDGTSKSLFLQNNS